MPESPHKYQSLDDYLSDLSNDKTFAEGVVIAAAAVKYRRPIHVFHAPDERPYVFESNDTLESVSQPIYLAQVSVNFGYVDDDSWMDQKNDHYVSLVQSRSR